MKKPPCADWDIWVGPEIEGTADLGERTVFIRRLPIKTIDKKTDLSFIRRKGSRLWLCKEFLHDCMITETLGWAAVRKLASMFDPLKVCLEVLPDTLESVPINLRRKHRLYLKVILPETGGLKDVDFVCVGPAYADRSFPFSSGVSVTPDQYLGDTKIL